MDEVERQLVEHDAISGLTRQALDRLAVGRADRRQVAILDAIDIERIAEPAANEVTGGADRLAHQLAFVGREDPGMGGEDLFRQRCAGPGKPDQEDRRRLVINHIRRPGCDAVRRECRPRIVDIAKEGVAIDGGSDRRAVMHLVAAGKGLPGVGVAAETVEIGAGLEMAGSVEFVIEIVAPFEPVETGKRRLVLPVAAQQDGPGDQRLRLAGVERQRPRHRVSGVRSSVHVFEQRGLRGVERRVRRRFRDGLIYLERRVKAAGLAAGGGKVAAIGHVRRCKVDGAAKRGDRRFRLPCRKLQNAEIVMGRGLARRERAGFRRRLDGPGGIPGK